MAEIIPYIYHFENFYLQFDIVYLTLFALL